MMICIVAFVRFTSDDSLQVRKMLFDMEGKINVAHIETASLDLTRKDGYFLYADLSRLLSLPHVASLSAKK